MGTASFSVFRRPRGMDPSFDLTPSRIRTSGAFTTTGTAAFIEDAAGDVEFAEGDVLQIHATEAMRIVFGGGTATTSTGHFLPADSRTEIEVFDSGKASIIDVA